MRYTCIGIAGLGGSFIVEEKWADCSSGSKIVDVPTSHYRS
jgi:hypothetical protein